MNLTENTQKFLAVYGFRPMAFTLEHGFWARGPVTLIADFKSVDSYGECVWEAQVGGAVSIMPSPGEALVAALERIRPHEDPEVRQIWSELCLGQAGNTDPQWGTSWWYFSSHWHYFDELPSPDQPLPARFRPRFYLDDPFCWGFRFDGRTGTWTFEAVVDRWVKMECDLTMEGGALAYRIRYRGEGEPSFECFITIDDLMDAEDGIDSIIGGLTNLSERQASILREKMRDYFGIADYCGDADCDDFPALAQITDAHAIQILLASGFERVTHPHYLDCYVRDAWAVVRDFSPTRGRIWSLVRLPGSGLIEGHNHYDTAFQSYPRQIRKLAHLFVEPACPGIDTPVAHLLNLRYQDRRHGITLYQHGTSQ